MRRATRWLAALTVVLAGLTGAWTPALADVEEAGAENIQDGDNSADADQEGESISGETVGGQVVGVNSSGEASVDARNHSEDVDLRSGDAEGENTASSYVGLQASSATSVDAADVTEVSAINVQDGDNEYTLDQSVTAISGDGVGGQVIGVIAAGEADPEIVAANSSEDVDVNTGDASGDNDAATFTGLNASTGTTDVSAPSEDVEVTDVESAEGSNIQDGDNDTDVDQSIDASTGDGVAGQVIGSMSSVGATSIDARNSSEDVDVDTGDASGDNDLAMYVGLNASTTTAVVASDVEDATAANIQDGDNSGRANQSVDASSGDGIAGQVIGAHTGGDVDVVAANETIDADVDTGDAEGHNDVSALVGLNVSTGSLEVGAADIEDADARNLQDGENDLSGGQRVDASTGDGVAGQILGVSSGGDVSVDASNRSEDVDVDTGEAEATNDLAAYIGLGLATTTSIEASDIETSSAANLQDGDNTYDFGQSADASSGDAIAGQAAAITAASGSADAVFANVSEDADAETGGSSFDNDEQVFVGLNVNGDLLTI